MVEPATACRTEERKYLNTAATFRDVRAYSAYTHTHTHTHTRTIARHIAFDRKGVLQDIDAKRLARHSEL